jgi:hypothetical protein
MSSPFDLEDDHPTAVQSDFDPDVQWLSIITRRLGNLNVIIAGEVDCIKGILMFKQHRVRSYPL